MTELEYLAKVASERTPGPLSAELYSCECCATIRPNEILYISNGLPCISPANARFFALAGTVADDLVAVAVAADRITELLPDLPGSKWEQPAAANQLRDAIASLKVAIRGAMK